MEDEENMDWSASKGLIAGAIVASVAVAVIGFSILRVAFILLLVDPIDDVPVAIL